MVRVVVRYRIKRRLFSIGEDYWLEDEGGRKAYKVDGKILRIRDTLVLEDPSGQEVATLRQRLLALHKTMDIEGMGERLATVRRALLNPLGERYQVELAGDGTLEAHGDITNHEFEIRDGHEVVAIVSRAWFSIHDTYGVDVLRADQTPLLLAVAIAIDHLHHEEVQRSRG
jgi:uncharacterized protein YxjI